MDSAARDQLIRDHLPLVHRVAERLRASWRDSGLEIDDLVGSGTVGLIQAADRFDPTKGARFKTYAEIVIEGAIRDGVGRGSCWFGRRAAGSVAVVHLDDLAPDGCEGWLGQAHDGQRLGPALWNGRPFFQPPSEGDVDLGPLLIRELQRLPERQRRVIELCFLGDKRLTQAAKEMGIRLPRASRLRKEALQRLRDALVKSGSHVREVAGPKSPAVVRNRKAPDVSKPEGGFETRTRATGRNGILAEVGAAA